MQTHALHTLIGGLVRRTRLVALVASIVCAGFAASAVAALVEASYLAPRSHGAAPPPAPAGKVVEPARTPADGSALVKRNMFCSTCAPVVDELGPADSVAPQAILIATALGDDPRATIRVPASEAQGSFGIGAKRSRGLARSVRIGRWVSVEVVDPAGRRGRIKLLDSRSVKPW